MSDVPTAAPGGRPTDEPAVHVPSTGKLIRAGIRGCVGGFVATIVMTVFRLPVFKGLPPTAEFWATYVSGEQAKSHFLPGLFLHVLYGTMAGGVYGLLVSCLDLEDPTRRELAGLLGGLGYGLGLSAFGSRVVFVRLLGRELRAEDALVFHAGHAVYGLSLGTFVAASEPVGEVYDQSEPTGATPEQITQ